MIEYQGKHRESTKIEQRSNSDHQTEGREVEDRKREEKRDS